MNISYGYNIYNLHNMMFQNTMSVYKNKLNNIFSPTNKVRGGNSLSAAATQYVNNIKAASNNLSSVLEELTSGAAFSRKAAVSSDSDAVSVTSPVLQDSAIFPISIEVKQLASGQINDGRSLDADSFAGLTGRNEFSIESGGKKTSFSINTSSSDTNMDIQQMMADAINSAGIGVKASVLVDSENNTSMLRLESANTGYDAENEFAVKDETGIAVYKMGVGNAVQTAKDAVYSVNGGADRTSKSNTVELGFGISATLKKASDEAVDISIGMDNKYARGKLQNMVNRYNSLYGEAFGNSDDPKAQKLASKLLSTVKMYKGALSNIGIGFDDAGKMTIDSAKMDAAEKSGRLEPFFTSYNGKSYGFANQLGKLASNVAYNTSNYVSKEAVSFNLFENFGYTSSGQSYQYNAMNSGWIFDYSF